MLMNVEEGVSVMLSRLRRPRCCFVMLTFAAVIVFAGGRPISAALQGHTQRGDIIMAHTQTAGPIQGELSPPAVSSSPPPSPSPSPQASPPPPPMSIAKQPICGNGKCEPPETIASCFADCPGVTTPAQCGEVRSFTHIITLLRPCSRLPTISCIPGTCTIIARPNRFVLLSFLLCCLIGALPACPSQEPHSDPGGEAVAWGLTHKTASAAECCERCAAHAADPKNRRKPCNSWVFCYMPQCWSLDTGHKHTFGECWLKWQVDASHPLYGQRGRYSDAFRTRHKYAHLTGTNVDGSARNLSVPSHVPWTGGVMGAHVDLSVQWETGPEGMTSSKGDALVNWRCAPAAPLAHAHAPSVCGRPSPPRTSHHLTSRSPLPSRL